MQYSMKSLDLSNVDFISGEDLVSKSTSEREKTHEEKRRINSKGEIGRGRQYSRRSCGRSRS